ncbi:hypothetical protein LASUN_02810 [Lentilactobacillus sunkii]|jgi:hypothetical protein|uniref:DUF5776 domain-containing protein n=1 Tax=Lentilactobacillus sunkii TaxID=481719 RepID=A0A1E7XIY7_9LACO|nr:DUF5776 domain-containing protein [Lentilactobacillus sunkii]OFA12942.1 hypothetical protein LASUN_02810 [Lentilactobacillus sunkii]
MLAQPVKFSFTRTARWVFAFAATIMFGGVLLHQPNAKAADAYDVTYTFRSTDTYGNPIDSPANTKSLTAKSDANWLDVSSVIPETLSNGRYTIHGYYTDNDYSGQYNYHQFGYREFEAAKVLKEINIHYPELKAGKTTVNTTFVYDDKQSTRERSVTLPEGALEREAGKLKTFYTDINGKEISPSIVYDYDKVPTYYSDFKNEINGYRYVAMVVRNPKPWGSYIYTLDKPFANMQVSNITDLLTQSILPLNYMLGLSKKMKQFDSGSTATYFYEKYAANLTVEYLDEAGKAMADHPAQTKQLDLNTDYSEEAPEIAGYTVVGDKKVTGKINDDTKITFKYKKNTVPPTPNNNNNKGSGTNNTNSTVTPTPSTNSNSSTIAPATNATADQVTPAAKPQAPRTLPDGTQLPNYAATEGTVVYATKAIYMYKQANFKKNQRIAKYPKVKRVNRPMFVVTDYARSNGGALRYKVKDVNHHSKTAGKVGYITASRKSVEEVYYASMPKNKKVTVISKKGVNVYQNANLTKKVKNYKTGSHLKVKKIVKHNLTTRYELSNGYYITANKKLVIHGTY